MEHAKAHLFLLPPPRGLVEGPKLGFAMACLRLPILFHFVYNFFLFRKDGIGLSSDLHYGRNPTLTRWWSWWISSTGFSLKLSFNLPEHKVLKVSYLSLDQSVSDANNLNENSYTTGSLLGVFLEWPSTKIAKRTWSAKNMATKADLCFHTIQTFSWCGLKEGIELWKKVMFAACLLGWKQYTPSANEEIMTLMHLIL